MMGKREKLGREGEGGGRSEKNERRREGGN